MEMVPSDDLVSAVSAGERAKNEYYVCLQMAILEQQTLLAPIVIDVYGNKKPLHLAYKSLLLWLSKLEGKSAEYRHELVGAEIVDQTPLETYIYQMRQRIPNFDSLDVWEQAGHIVVKQFDNMTQLLERHALRQLKAKDEKHADPRPQIPKPRAKSPARRTPRRR